MRPALFSPRSLARTGRDEPREEEIQQNSYTWISSQQLRFH